MNSSMMRSVNFSLMILTARTRSMVVSPSSKLTTFAVIYFFASIARRCSCVQTSRRSSGRVTERSLVRGSTTSVLFAAPSFALPPVFPPAVCVFTSRFLFSSMVNLYAQAFLNCFLFFSAPTYANSLSSKSS